VRAATPSDPALEVAAELGNIRTRMGELAGQVTALGRRIEAITRQEGGAAATREGIKKIEDRLAGLTEDTRDLPRLAERLCRLERRADGADASVMKLGARVEKAIESQKALPKLASAIPVATPARGVMSARPENVTRKTTFDPAPGVAAFTQGQYARAADTFRSLAKQNPDARAWYYAALATGLATNRWSGEVEEVVGKRVERERAGTPANAEIDATFAGLTPATGRTGSRSTGSAPPDRRPGKVSDVVAKWPAVAGAGEST
jgi:hypothetical protein